MARRLRPVPSRDGPEGMPERLAHPVAEDWLTEEDRPSAYWGPDWPPIMYYLITARRRWRQACDEWFDEQGVPRGRPRLEMLPKGPPRFRGRHPNHTPGDEI